ncbi:MAG: hypothetical protein K6C34_00325, partial [Alphaproteobacteria bacterium]|nr:hypothetical protein [Alphaproteobacteria bacterium]
ADLLKLFNNLILKQKIVRNLKQIFSFTKSEDECYKRTKIVLCGLKISIKTPKSFVSVDKK